MKKSFLNILLVSSFLSIPVSASDFEELLNVQLTSQTPLVQSALPSKSLTEEIYGNFKQYASEFIQDTQKGIKIAKDAYVKRDVGGAVLELFEAHMKSGSKEFLRTYFKPQVNSDEFDVEALLPLVEKVQNTFYGLVDGMLYKKPLYVSYKGEKLSVMEDKTVVRKFLEALIPNAVPLKGVAISLADIPVIRSYLVRKTNEATLHYLLQFYQKCTGSTAKKDIKNFINQFLQTEENVISSPTTDSLSTSSSLEVQEAEKNSSKLWAYLEPRVTHLLRASFTKMMLPIFEKSFKEFTLELNHRVAPKGSMGSAMLSSATMGMLTTAWFTGGNPLATVIVGAPVGAAAYLTGNFGAKSVAKTFLDRIEKHKNLYISYYLNQALPETKGEHLLYNLNPNPTEIEKEIFAADYHSQAIQREQSLLQAAFSDLSQISGVASLIQNYTGAFSASLRSFTVTNNEYAAFLWGNILRKQERGIPLTKTDIEIIGNLQRYPSFNIKQQEAEIIKQWKENQQFKEYSEEQKKKFLKAQKKIIAVYELYAEEIPSTIAAAYQELGYWSWDNRFALDFIEVEDIMRHHLERNLKTLQPKELDVLKRAYQDSMFLTTFLQAHLTQHLDRNADHGKVKTLLEAEDFLKNMMSKYVEYFYQKYQTSNQAELKQLEDSILGIDLSPIQLVELHARMTQEEKERYLSVDNEKATQAKEEELRLIQNQVKTVVEENTKDIAEHYANQLMRQFDLKQFITWAFQHNPSLVGDILSKVEEEKKEVASAASEILNNVLMRTPLGKDFAGKLNNFKREGSELRRKVSEVIVTNYFYDYLLRNSDVLENLFLIPSQDLYGFELVNEASTTIAPSKEEKRGVESIKKVWDNQSRPLNPFTDSLKVGVFQRNHDTLEKVYLVQILNKLSKNGQIKDFMSLSSEEVEKIQKEIHHQNREDLLEFTAKEFLEKDTNLHYVMVEHFLPSIPVINNKLFYSYGDIFDKRVKEKNALIEEIMKREIQKN